MPSIRAANVADSRAIARIDVETWRATYAGVLPDRLLVDLSEHHRAETWSRFIQRWPGDTLAALDERGTVLGFGSCGAQRESNLPFSGEVFTLYVAPDHQGQGVGRLLLLGLFQRLVRRGLYSAVVWVLAENPARFFYERLGGHIAARRHIDMARCRVDAAAYVWPDLAEAIRNRGRAKSRIE
jgi:ribosomal protein S18 acetylase RimI-like enzyme